MQIGLGPLGELRAGDLDLVLFSLNSPAVKLFRRTALSCKPLANVWLMQGQMPRASLHHTREVSHTHLRRACTSKEQYMAQRYWLRNLHQSRVEKRSVNSLGLVGSWTCVLDPLRAVRECHRCMPPPGEGMTPPYGHTEGNRITREVENISASGVFQKVFRNI